ncbi:MAG: ribosome small subunit-dependent GTPase A [Ruminococcaceae bacterium]|nr:ribosome small subunit-dependent GTPase A [Oscillospiraceae bacterium]
MQERSVEGLILQGIGGFYYVEAADGVYECRARGSLRNLGVTPYAGDRVTITVDDSGKGVLEAVAERKNSLIRPPVANLDVLVLVISMTDPEPSLPVIDRMLAVAEHKGIEPMMVFNKTDLASSEELEELYGKAGYTVLSVCANDPQTIEPLKALLAGKVCAFAGNSGVGKSSVINVLDPSLALSVGETSKKLGRGRHTTRSARLYPQAGGGYLADTPGFSSLDAQRLEHIDKEELCYCFREFEPFLDGCRFTSCSHTVEKGCRVRQAVEDGDIALSRHESYAALYKEAKEWKEWENK